MSKDVEAMLTAFALDARVFNRLLQVFKAMEVSKSPSARQKMESAADERAYSSLCVSNRAAVAIARNEYRIKRGALNSSRRISLEEEVSAILIKPQSASNGLYGSIEI